MFKKIISVLILATAPYAWGMKQDNAEKSFAKKNGKAFVAPKTDCVYIVHFDKTVTKIKKTSDGKTLKNKSLFKDVWGFYIHPETECVYIKDFFNTVTMYSSDSTKSKLLAKNVENIFFHPTTGYVYVLGECFWSCGGPVSVYSSDGQMLNDGKPFAKDVCAISIDQKTGLVSVRHWDTTVRVYTPDGKLLS